MSGGELMVIGKLLLTFGVLVGLPVVDLWLMRRHLRSARPGARSEKVD